MSRLYIAPFGMMDEFVMQSLDTAAAEWFPFPLARLAPVAVPADAYDARRNQYQSVRLMQSLAEILPRGAARLLGVTELDLSIPMLSFIFGQAQLEGKIALLSVCRLRQEFYGLPAGQDLLRRRIVKEALHELGHTSGLIHCQDAKCVMSLATHIALVDEKSESYCARCGRRLARRLAAEANAPAIEEALP